MRDFVDQIKPLFDRVIQLKKEMAWILIGQALCFVGGFVGIKVLTNIMGPEGYGQLALGLTIAGLFNLFIYGPIANVVARFYSVCRERGTLGVYFAVLRRFHKILVLTLTLLSLLAGGVAWSLAGEQWGLLVAIASLFGVVGGVNTSYISLQSAIRDRKVVALHQGADVWIRIGLSILFLFLFQKSGYIALLGYLVGTLLVTCSQSFFAHKNELIRSNWSAEVTSGLIDKECSREFLGYAASFTLFSAFAAISMYADRWILQGLFGAREVGIYAAIYQIASSPINMFFAMTNRLMVPIIFDRAGSMTTVNQEKQSLGLMYVTVAFSGVFLIIIIAISAVYGEFIVSFVTNNEYAEFHNILWLSVLGLSIFNIGQLLSLKGICFNKPKTYILPKAFQAMSFLGVAYFMATKYGMLGISYSLCISSVFYCILVIMANTNLTLRVNNDF